jgi:hypothetical protein
MEQGSPTFCSPLLLLGRRLFSDADDDDDESARSHVRVSVPP